MKQDRAEYMELYDRLVEEVWRELVESLSGVSVVDSNTAYVKVGEDEYELSFREHWDGRMYIVVERGGYPYYCFYVHFLRDEEMSIQVELGVMDDGIDSRTWSFLVLAAMVDAVVKAIRRRVMEEVGGGL